MSGKTTNTLSVGDVVIAAAVTLGTAAMMVLGIGSNRVADEAEGDQPARPEPTRRDLLRRHYARKWGDG